MDSLKSPPPLFISLLKLFFGVVLGIFILIAGIFGYKFLYVIIIYTKWLIPPITGALHLPADFRGVAVTEVIVLATVFLAVWLLLRVFLAFTWISFWRDILLLKGKEKLFRVMTRITKIIFYSPYMCNGILWIIVIIGMINTARTVEHQKAYSEDAKSKATISNYTETPLVIPGTGKTVGLKVQFDLVYPPPPAEIRKNDYIMLPSFNIKSNQPIAPSRSGWLWQFNVKPVDNLASLNKNGTSQIAFYIWYDPHISYIHSPENICFLNEEEYREHTQGFTENIFNQQVSISIQNLSLEPGQVDMADILERTARQNNYRLTDVQFWKGTASLTAGEMEKKGYHCEKWSGWENRRMNPCCRKD